MADPEEKTEPTLTDKYKLKGAQEVTYAQYEAARTKREKAGKEFKLPFFVKIILGAPVAVIFLGGVLFIPYMLYLIATSPSAPAPVDKPVVESSADSGD